MWDMLAIFGLQWEFPESVKELLLGWKVKLMDKGHRRVWSMAPLCLFCCVWQERNRRIFDRVEFNNLNLKESVVMSSMDWFGILLGRDCASLLDFMDDLIVDSSF